MMTVSDIITLLTLIIALFAIISEKKEKPSEIKIQQIGLCDTNSLLYSD